MKHCIALFILATVLIFSGFWAPTMAAKTDQTHLSKLVKTKQMLLIEATRLDNENLQTKMDRINAYEATLADYLGRAHQLRFLITVSESNPFEVRMYFKRAAELRSGLEREIRKVRGMAKEIQYNLSIVDTARQDLHFIVQSSVSTKEKQDAQSLLNELDRFETTLLKIKKPLEAVLARSDKVENLSMKWEEELQEEITAVWSFYFTEPLFVLFDKDVLKKLSVAYSLWAGAIGPTLESKLPDSPVEWGQSACAFLAFGFTFLFIFRWALGRAGTRSHGNQDQWTAISRTSSLSVFLFSSFWGAAMIGGFPENVIFSRLAGLFGSLTAISLAWGLRNIKIRSALPSPLIPFFCLYAVGIVSQIANMNLRLLGVFWPVGVGIMMFFVWRRAGKYKNPAPRKLARFCFWSGFPIIGLSLAGFTFPSIEVFLTIFLCAIFYQFASAVSDLIRRRVTRLQEKGDSLFHSVFISLGIPIIWFLCAGMILFWLASQFGDSGFLELTKKIRFTWQDIDIGFAQVIAAVTLFFVIKPIVEVLKDGVERIARKSLLDEAVMIPVQTMLVYGVWAVYGLLFLHIIGVKLSSIIVLAGGLSVGIGFGLQHIINNFVSGLILLFGRSVRPGDVIEHDLVMGVVEKVTIRNTLVRTRDDTTMLIPNSNLVSMPFVNMSRNNRAVRLIVAVGAAYDSDPDLVKRLMMAAAQERAGVLKHPAPRVRFEGFQDSSLDFRIKFWVDFDGSKRIASDLRFAILKKFREHSVEISFPQLDLHLKEVPREKGGHATIKKGAVLGNFQFPNEPRSMAVYPVPMGTV
ncbi:MAG: hypothetical protein B6240_00230 [Desulfobacteraceae bacterium 4572_87]|nr:MAG: hypothetical protein B6240_00230 [Desulfobacteraceae bacterium 4572_87]